MAQTPIEKARVRQGRDDGRPTEDDPAKAKLGPRGVPLKPDKPPVADAHELQLPPRFRALALFGLDNSPGGFFLH
jgi:hypothetical protein